MYSYTFIMEYLEGSYISQVNAVDEKTAMRVWLNELDVDVVSSREKKRLMEEDFEGETPILIEGMKNVWCFGLRINKRKRIALINIIKTIKE